MRKVYTDPALKNNKKWSVYTTQSLYKQFKTADVTTEYGIMRMVNEALELYIALFPNVHHLQREADELDMDLIQYIVEVIKERPPIDDR